MNRRRFLKLAAASAAVTPFGATCYGYAEATNLKVDRQTIAVPRLPAAFRGLTAAFLTDIHLGPYISEEYVAATVRTAMALAPDLVLLGGDYSHKEERYIAPCFEHLAQLSAPLGVYGVLGNHDYWHGRAATRHGMARAHVEELTNRGVWLRRGGDRLRLAGVDDLWAGTPDVAAAVGPETTAADACVLLSHNPDVAETLTDRRVGLVLSGHTHGGQVVVPGYGPPLTMSRYGQKYAHGLVDAPTTQVYVSAGIGMTVLPVRGFCRPEITLITLA